MDYMLQRSVPVIYPEVFLPAEGIRACFSTRHGGVSTPPFYSLNLGLSTGDVPERVQENRKRFFKLLGASPEDLAIGNQVHGNQVAIVEQPGVYPVTDGLVTRTPDVLLGIAVADCSAVLLADPLHRVIGACHAGWRGAAANIVRETVHQMQALGATPPTIKAFISPCLSVHHFEIGPDVAQHFSSRYLRNYPGKPRPHLDLKALLVDQLHACGIPLHQIEVAPQCTFEHNELFFSYRAEQGQCGRMMGCIALSPDIRSNGVH